MQHVSFHPSSLAPPIHDIYPHKLSFGDRRPYQVITSRQFVFSQEYRAEIVYRPDIHRPIQLWGSY